jgi:hypothetical protein
MRTSFYHLLEFCDPRRNSAAGRSETAASRDRPPMTLSDHTPQSAIKPDVYLRISCDIPAISLIFCTFGRIVGQFHHSAVDWQVAERQKGYAGWSLPNIFLAASVVVSDAPVASSLETGESDKAIAAITCGALIHMSPSPSYITPGGLNVGQSFRVS